MRSSRRFVDFLQIKCKTKSEVGSAFSVHFQGIRFSKSLGDKLKNIKTTRLRQKDVNVDIILKTAHTPNTGKCTQR